MRGGPGPVNVCSPDPVAIGSLIALVEKTCGKRMLRAAAETAGNASPFGIPSDWWMNTAKLQAAGFRCQPVNSWLPGLIRELFRQVTGE